jgi:hypothetical protein
LRPSNIHDVTRSGNSVFPLLQFLEYQKENHVFEGVIGAGWDAVLFGSGYGTAHYEGALVTVNTFQFLGVPPLIGRGITPDDIKPDAPPVFVMAYRMWGKRFNRDTSVLGRTFTLNGTPTTLVGIMPPQFTKRAAESPPKSRGSVLEVVTKSGGPAEDIRFETSPQQVKPSLFNGLSAPHGHKTNRISKLDSPPDFWWTPT